MVDNKKKKRELDNHSNLWPSWMILGPWSQTLETSRLEETESETITKSSSKKQVIVRISTGSQ